MKSSVPEALTYSTSYHFQPVLFFAAVGSAAVLFGALFLLLLQSYFVPHGLFYFFNPVQEMTGYIEFLLVTFACFYLGAFLTLWGERILSTIVPSWGPTFVLGSLFLGIYTAIRLDGGLDALILMFFAATFVTGISCAIASIFLEIND